MIQRKFGFDFDHDFIHINLLDLISSLRFRIVSKSKRREIRKGLKKGLYLGQRPRPKGQSL